MTKAKMQAGHDKPARGRETLDLKWQTPKHSPNETAMQKGQLGQDHRGPRSREGGQDKITV